MGLSELTPLECCEMAGAEMAGFGSAVATRSGRMGSVGDPPSGSSVMNWPETVEPEGKMKKKGLVWKDH